MRRVSPRPTRTRLLAALRSAAPLLCAAGLATGAAAQTAHFSFVSLTLGSGLLTPEQTAVDNSGNVYIADTTNSRVLKETRAAGSFTQSVVASGIDEIVGVAVDPSGDVFASSANDNEIFEEKPNGGSYTQSVVLSSGLSVPTQLALDQNGNLYICDQNNNRVLVLSPSGGVFTQTAVISTGSNSPGGVAVDPQGNVYIAVPALTQIVKETPTGGGTYSASTFGSGLSRPNGVAVDALGRVYVTTDFGNTLVLETPSGGVYTQTTLLSGLNQPIGAGADLTGNFVAFSVANDDSVTELQLEGGDLGSELVGSTTTSLPLTFTFDSGGTIGAPVVLTGGQTGLDFADAGTGTCTTNGTSHTYSTGNTCTVNVTFAPSRTGLRSGAVELTDNSGNVIATAFIRGVGAGPQLTFDSGATSTLNTGNTIGSPRSVAVDAQGNTYFADFNTGNIVKVPAGGGTGTVLHSGAGQPRGIAVDAAGNVYYDDVHNVQEITPSGAITTVATLNVPQSIAMDGLGNLFVADSFANEVVEITASGLQANFGTSLNNPAGVAVDASGTLYVGDQNNNRVVKIPLGCVSAGCQSQFGSGLNDPVEVAVDAAGNTFIADVGNSRIVEVASGGAQTTLLTGGQLFGIALDAAGNLYGDDGTIITRGTPPTLSFGNITYGQTSAAKTVTVTNAGTASLTATNLSIAAGYVQQASGGTDCSSTIVLASDSACTLQLAFQPTGAAVSSGSAILTDNNLNGSSVLQTVTLGGTGTAATITPSLTGTVSKTYDGTTNATLAAGNYAFTGTVGSDDVGITHPTSGAYTGAAAGTGVTVTSGTIALTGTTAANYQLATTTASGNVGTITKASATPSLTGTVTKTYDGTTTATLAANNFSLAGIIAGDTANVTASGAATYATAGAGTGIAVNATGVGISGSASGNYSLSATTANGNVGTISKASVTPSLTGTVAKTYDGTTTATLAANNFSLAGVIPADTANVTASGTATYASANAGTGITVNSTGIGISGTASSNYSLAATTANGAVGSITKAGLTVTASSPSMIYGGAAPTITPAYGGFVNSQTASVLTTAPTCTTTATSASAAGSPQTSSCSGATAANYSFTFVPGTVTVNKAGLTITASSPSMTYGGAAPTVTPSFSGFVNSDTSAALTTQPTCNTTATSASAAGSTQTTACSGAAAANYSFTFVPGSVTVNKAPLGVSAAPASIAFGAAIPAFSPSYSGFVNSDTAANLTGSPSLTTTATSSSAVGSYPITVAAGTLASNNYSFTFTNGSLTIGTAPQTITFNTIATQTFGAAPLTLTASSTSSLPVTFTLISGPASLSGTTLTLTGGGTVTVEADQAGNTSFQAAAAVRQSFTVTAPALTLSPATLAFGNDLVGSATAAQAVTVSNTGNAAMAISSITATGDYTQTNNCPASLAANASCTVSVVFTASANGARSGTLTVATALAGTQTATLSGTGVSFVFAVAPGTPLSQIIDGGQTAIYALAITPQSFTGTVALSCGILPATATCTISPSTIALTAGGPATSITVSVPTVSRSLLPLPPSHPPIWPWLLLLAGLPFALYLRRQRTWLMGALTYGLIFAAACGGTSNALGAGGGTPPGIYQITATATVGAVSQPVHLTLEVQ